MSEINDESSDIAGDDIIFDCEHCGRSLVIDLRGAGLKVNCPECGGKLIVPIPEGVELSDIDFSLSAPPVEVEDEKKSADTVDGGNGGGELLESELEELRLRTEHLERSRALHKEAVRELCGHVEAVRTALKEIDYILGRLAEKSSEETQELG